MKRTAICYKIFYILYIANVVAIEGLFIYMNIREIKATKKDIKNQKIEKLENDFSSHFQKKKIQNKSKKKHPNIDFSSRNQIEFLYGISKFLKKTNQKKNLLFNLLLHFFQITISGLVLQVRLLRSVDLSFNNIVEIPAGLPLTLPHLQYLNISHNQLTSLPDSIFGFIHLQAQFKQR